MAWPNKKRAPDSYFIPLIHPTTLKACPVPERGWRNPPRTMERLLREERVIFGVDETTQPRRKYFLHEVQTENVPSIFKEAVHDRRLANMTCHSTTPSPSPSPGESSAGSPINRETSSSTSLPDRGPQAMPSWPKIANEVRASSLS